MTKHLCFILMMCILFDYSFQSIVQINSNGIVFPSENSIIDYNNPFAPELFNNINNDVYPSMIPNQLDTFNDEMPMEIPMQKVIIIQKRSNLKGANFIKTMGFSNGLSPMQVLFNKVLSDLSQRNNHLKTNHQVNKNTLSNNKSKTKVNNTKRTSRSSYSARTNHSKDLHNNTHNETFSLERNYTTLANYQQKVIDLLSKANYEKQLFFLGIMLLIIYYIIRMIINLKTSSKSANDSSINTTDDNDDEIKALKFRKVL